MAQSTLTVSELCNRVRATVEESFPDEIWIQGAISGLTRSNNGHVYFDLIDPTDVGQNTEAVLPVALFSSSRHLVNRILRRAGGIRMHDGIEIRIRGQVAYYPPQGRVQLVMSLIDPNFTLGQMVMARQELLDKLTVEGLADKNRQLEFPVAPLRVALITSNGSAAFADFVHELENSGYPFEVTLIDSRVQGLEAVPSLTAALRATDDLAVDVVAVVRGGGARTDLVAFDSEQVARAIARCRYPVLVGVGHEIDRSVADEIAYMSTKTPTATAAALVDALAEYEEQVEHFRSRLEALTRFHLATARDHLFGCGGRLVSASNRTVDRQRLELSHAGRRLNRSPRRILEQADGQLVVDSTRLSALDPAVALRRGWTITRTESGELVRSIDRVEAGMILRTTTVDGTIASEVKP